MIALLDTHSFLWALIDPKRLPQRVRAVIADSANAIHLSTISLWEISLKYALGKLELTACKPEDLVPLAKKMGLSLATPTAEESAGFYKLPRTAHKDPFDRMLIWQCLQRDWTLITRDSGLDEYRALGLKAYW